MVQLFTALDIVLGESSISPTLRIALLHLLSVQLLHSCNIPVLIDGAVTWYNFDPAVMVQLLCSSNGTAVMQL